jgi:glycosyltransferase involved in cell wall biosynthesis
MPSRHEGLCRALLEAMAAGTCPVVSDAGGMKEMVRAGRDGLVVPRENVPALADAIRLLHADRGRLAACAASARQRMADVCTPQAFADRVLAVHALAAA